MLQFFKAPVYKKLEQKNTYYHGVITAVEPYESKGREYLSLSIEMEEGIFKTSVRATIDSEHVLYNLAMLLSEELEDEAELTEEDFVNCRIKFMVSDINKDYSRLDVVEAEQS